MEQQPLYNGWNFSYGFDNLYGTTARSATIISGLLCPADIIPANPIQNGTTSNEWYGITSYGGNAGTQSHPFSAVTSDGIFFYTGPAAPTFYQVRISGVTDGLSNTLFFGERNHFDPNYDTFAPPGWTFFSQTMGMWGWWASSSGGYGLSDVAESTYSPINYVVPISYGSPVPRVDPERPSPRTTSTRGSTPSAVCTRAVRTSRWSTARCDSSSRSIASPSTTPWGRGPAAR